MSEGRPGSKFVSGGNLTCIVFFTCGGNGDSRCPASEFEALYFKVVSLEHCSGCTEAGYRDMDSATTTAFAAEYVF